MRYQEYEKGKTNEWTERRKEGRNEGREGGRTEGRKEGREEVPSQGCIQRRHAVVEERKDVKEGCKGRKEVKQGREGRR